MDSIQQGGRGYDMIVLFRLPPPVGSRNIYFPSVGVVVTAALFMVSPEHAAARWLPSATSASSPAAAARQARSPSPPTSCEPVNHRVRSLHFSSVVAVGELRRCPRMVFHGARRDKSATPAGPLLTAGGKAPPTRPRGLRLDVVGTGLG